jgi:hypothetical protein
MKHNVDYETLKVCRFFFSYLASLNRSSAQNYVTTLASKSLNKNLSYKKQPKAMITHIIDKVNNFANDEHNSLTSLRPSYSFQK